MSSMNNEAMPFAMRQATELRPLTDEELDRVAGGSTSVHWPQDGVTQPTFDND